MPRSVLRMLPVPLSALGTCLSVHFLPACSPSVTRRRIHFYLSLPIISLNNLSQGCSSEVNHGVRVIIQQEEHFCFVPGCPGFNSWHPFLSSVPARNEPELRAKSNPWALLDGTQKQNKTKNSTIDLFFMMLWVEK